jgi:magnesium-protoporphyrin O-methyltransferase
VPCSQCEGIEKQFDPREARRKLAEYHRHGPTGTTKRLIDALRAAGVEGARLLDIGGGVGAVTLALLEAGAAEATHVDASRAYIDVAREEAARHGLVERVTYRHGDFVALAEEVPEADIVTLDRVICCYHDMPALMGRALDKARAAVGLVYPRDRWWMRAAVWLLNLGLAVMRDPFRGFVHRERDLEAVVRAHGFTPRFRSYTLVWQVAVYSRAHH